MFTCLVMACAQLLFELPYIDIVVSENERRLYVLRPWSINILHFVMCELS